MVTFIKMDRYIILPFLPSDVTKVFADAFPHLALGLSHILYIASLTLDAIYNVGTLTRDLCFSFKGLT